MNNDLEQFSEERLKEIVQHGLNRGIYSDDLKSLARIALAAKQAKPVVNAEFKDGWPVINMMGVINGSEKLSDGFHDLYTNPQPAHTEQDGWIKCSDRMPKDSQWCVVNTEYGYYVQCWGSEQGWLGDEISIPNYDVTHWMPLPAAPKPESE